MWRLPTSRDISEKELGPPEPARCDRGPVGRKQEQICLWLVGVKKERERQREINTWRFRRAIMAQVQLLDQELVLKTIPRWAQLGLWLWTMVVTSPFSYLPCFPSLMCLVVFDFPEPLTASFFTLWHHGFEKLVPQPSWGVYYKTGRFGAVHCSWQDVCLRVCDGHCFCCSVEDVYISASWIIWLVLIGSGFVPINLQIEKTVSAVVVP